MSEPDDPAGTDGFAQYLVHPENREAVEACRAVAEGRWTGARPLVLWGPLGCGKSHLLRAIEARLLTRAPGTAVVCLNTAMIQGIPRGAEFLGDALLAGPVEELGLLLVDDLSLTSWSGGVQRWLARVLLGLREGGGQAVVTIDEFGAPDFEERSSLDSLAAAARFVGRPLEFSATLKALVGAGHFVRLGLPGEPARRELLARYAAERRIEVSDEALGILARRLPGEVVWLWLAIDRLASRLRAEPGGFQGRWADEIADWLTAGPGPDDGTPILERVQAAIEEHKERMRRWSGPEPPGPRTH